jgi:hypothetical protein
MSCWCALVENCSARDLMFPEDRPLAIAGVAAEVQ